MKIEVKDKIFIAAVRIVILLTCVLVIYPIWHVLMVSISDPVLSLKGGFFIIPKGFTLDNYKYLLHTKAVVSSYKNVIFVAFVGTAVNVLLIAFTAYPLTRKNLPGRKIMTMIVFITIVFYGGMIPTFMVVRACGLINKLWSLILPGAVSPFYTFVMVNFFRSIPSSLEESAKIDGANDIHIFFRIIVPLSLPVLASVGLMCFVFHWNSYFWCVLYINDTSKYTLQVVIRDVLIKLKGDTLSGGDVGVSGAFGKSATENLKMALVGIAIIPVLIIYPFIQRFFVKGVTLGAVKG